jgi:hypothetical protein
MPHLDEHPRVDADAAQALGQAKGSPRRAAPVVLAIDDEWCQLG